MIQRKRPRSTSIYDYCNSHDTSSTFPNTMEYNCTAEKSLERFALSNSLEPPQKKTTVRFKQTSSALKGWNPSDEFETKAEWMSALWYHKSDLINFHNEADIISKHIRLMNKASRSSDSDSASNRFKQREPSFAMDSYTRGLERRWCKERQRRRLVSSKFILKAAAILKREKPGEIEANAIKLAAVARRCSSYAVSLAAEEGLRDYQRAYDSKVPCAYDEVQEAFWSTVIDFKT